MKKRKIIGITLTMLILSLFVAVPVLAYDGMGGMSAESSIGTTTNYGFLVINTLTSPYSEFDINSSSNYPAGINQATNLARTIIPLLAVVSILIIMGIAVAKLGGDTGLTMLEVDNPISIIIILALIAIMAMAFLPAIVASVNSLI
jgi:hypothetical protein